MPSRQTVLKTLTDALREPSKDNCQMVHRSLPATEAERVNVGRLSESDFRLVVEAALTAPSGDNCQPFLFENTAEGVVIHHDGDRAAHLLNADALGSYITLGCTLESAAIAASGLGYHLNYALLGSITGADRGLTPVARFTLVPGAKADPLALHLSERHTDRRPFQGGHLDAPLFRRIAAMASAFPGVGVRIIPPKDDDLAASICWLDRLIWEHREGHRDLMRWLRLSQTQIQATNDGMPWPTLGIRGLELVAMRLMRHWGAQRIANALGATRMMERLCRQLMRSSAGLVLITISEPSRVSEVDAGRLALRIWVALNAERYGVQPMSIAPLMTYLAAQNRIPNLAPAYLERIKGLAAQFTTSFGLASDERPFWMLRTGLSTPLPPNRRCKRRSWTDATLGNPV